MGANKTKAKDRSSSAGQGPTTVKPKRAADDAKKVAATKATKATVKLLHFFLVIRQLTPVHDVGVGADYDELLFEELKCFLEGRAKSLKPEREYFEADEIVQRTLVYLSPRITNGQTDSLLANYVDQNLEWCLGSWEKERNMRGHMRQAMLALEEAIQTVAQAAPDDGINGYPMYFLEKVAGLDALQAILVFEYLHDQTAADIQKLLQQWLADKQKAADVAKCFERAIQQIIKALQAQLKQTGQGTSKKKEDLAKQRFVAKEELKKVKKVKKELNKMFKELENRDGLGLTDMDVSKTIAEKLREFEEVMELVMEQTLEQIIKALQAQLERTGSDTTKKEEDLEKRRFILERSWRGDAQTEIAEKLTALKEFKDLKKLKTLKKRYGLGRTNADVSEMIDDKDKELKRLEEIEGAAKREETKKLEELKNRKVRRKHKKDKMLAEVRELKEIKKLEKKYGLGCTNAD